MSILALKYTDWVQNRLNFRFLKMGVLKKDPLIQDWVFRLGSRTYQLPGQWYTILMVRVWCPQVTLVKPKYSKP